MTYFAHSTRALVERLFGLLELFDPSFFVSGAAFVAALLFSQSFPGVELLLGLADGELHNVPALGWTLLVVASYIAGLACFSLGRAVRKRWLRWFRGEGASTLLFELFEAHGLMQKNSDHFELSAAGRQIPWLERYVVPLESLDTQEQRSAAMVATQGALYVHMWAELRRNKELAPSFSLLRRYWVSAATLDGLLVAGLCWAYALSSSGYRIGAAASCVGAFLAAFEAHRYELHQRSELVATIAQAYDNAALPQKEERLENRIL